MPELVTADKCTGCAACAAICPTQCIVMKPDTEGFLHPQIDSACCIECHRCESTCPLLFKGAETQQETEAYGACNKDAAVVKRSSSGGMFSLLANKIIEDEGVVFGAAFESPERVKHIAVDDKQQLWRLCSSKYVQSEICSVYQQVQDYLKKDIPVLFSGTPCQIAGLKAYLKKDYSKLVCIDTICHSVPSPKVWKEFLKEVEDDERSRILNVNFREKQSGWENYSLYLKFENGKEKRYFSQQNIYMHAFIEGLSTRPSCYSCEFKGAAHVSDITLGDFWGVRQAAPECFDEQGTSLVLIHNEKGRALLQRCDQDAIITPVAFDSAIAGNPAYAVSSCRHPHREKFFKILGTTSLQTLIPSMLEPTAAEKVKSVIRRSIPAKAMRRMKQYIKR